jgi:hypothetical protein
MTTRTFASFAFLCLLSGAHLIGCDSAQYGLAPVSGIVTLDGQPVPGAQVSFQPQGSGTNTNPGPGSTGLCDDSGRYELTTIRKEPGAVPGPHAVRIYGPRGNADTSSDADAPGRKEVFPSRYNFQTELTFEVPSECTDAANFELTSK